MTPLEFRWLPAHITIYCLLVPKVKIFSELDENWSVAAILKLEGTVFLFFSRFSPIFANKSHFTCHKPLKISYIPPDETLNIVQWLIKDYLAENQKIGENCKTNGKISPKNEKNAMKFNILVTNRHRNPLLYTNNCIIPFYILNNNWIEYIVHWFRSISAISTLMTRQNWPKSRKTGFGRNFRINSDFNGISWNLQGMILVIVTQSFWCIYREDLGIFIDFGTFYEKRVWKLGILQKNWKSHNLFNPLSILTKFVP